MMLPFDLLQVCLLDLLYELRQEDLRLILGGGYGLFLKRREIERQGVSTLLTSYPRVRSTNDLDLFLRTEIVADARRFELLAQALERMSCRVVPDAA